jgi:hypothetical protein
MIDRCARSFSPMVRARIAHLWITRSHQGAGDQMATANLGHNIAPVRRSLRRGILVLNS